MLKNKINPKSTTIVFFMFTLLFFGAGCGNQTEQEKQTEPVKELTEQKVDCGGAVEYSGQNYNTVGIGSQCWLKENLKVTKNPEGKAITRYCYNNDPKICETDGGLYNWNTTMNGSKVEGAQGICPNGWHIPKDSEWYILEKGLAVGSCVANRQGITGGWDCNQAGTKLKSGEFHAVIAGYHIMPDNYPYFRGMSTFFWSSTEVGSVDAWLRSLDSENSTVNRFLGYKPFGLSVRCLKD